MDGNGAVPVTLNDMKRKNRPEEVELIDRVRLNPDKHPIAFKGKVSELMKEQGLSEEEARKRVEGTEFYLEIYYEPGYGLFAVDPFIVECAEIRSPYTGDIYHEYEV